MLTAARCLPGIELTECWVPGHGLVYRHNPDLARGEALKVLSPELSGDPRVPDPGLFVRRSWRRAWITPTSSGCSGAVEFEGQLWIAMQFVDGTNAADAVGCTPMVPARAVHIVGEVAKALERQRTPTVWCTAM